MFMRERKTEEDSNRQEETQQQENEGILKMDLHCHSNFVCGWGRWIDIEKVKENTHRGKKKSPKIIYDYLLVVSLYVRFVFLHNFVYFPNSLQ